MYFFSLTKEKKVHLAKGKIIPADDFAELVTAKELIDLAKEEAAQIIEEAKKESVFLKQQAQESGFTEGLARFNEQLLHFDESVKVLRHEVQRAVLPLVLKATKKIVGEQLEINPESIVHIVMQSIKSVSQSHRVKLYVNKEDLEILEGAKESLKSIFERLDSFLIEERPDVPRGGCIIETEKGILNATLENQYRALERAFELHVKGR